MNDQSKLMNPPHPPQMIGQPPPPQMMNMQPPPQVMNSVQTPLLGYSHGLNHPIMNMNQQPQLMMNPRNFNLNPVFNSEYQNPPSNFASRTNRKIWKGKNNTSEKRPIRRRHNSGVPMYNPQQLGGGIASGSVQVGPAGAGGYQPPTLNELQSQNRLKTRKFYPKKNFGNRYIPYAPRNTTSFIIRAKKSGGIAELVSPCPVTPAVLPTPMFSPSREVLGDMAKEEWGVDGYGSMKGLIRLRSDGHELGAYDDEDEDEGDSSDSDVEEHVEVERRLDHDLSRFEMIYPNYGGTEYNNVLENRVDDQDSHIAHLEEENLTLKERLFLIEREFSDMRRRLQYLERRDLVAGDVNEEVVENEFESDGDDTGGSETKENHVAAEDVCMQEVVARDEAKESKVSVGMGSSEGHKPDRVVVSVDQSKETEMEFEKIEDASENDSVGEQGTSI